MTKQKMRDEELRAFGKQSTPHPYSAMDYYFDHLKTIRRIGADGRTKFGVKVKGYATKNITATQEFVRDLTYAKDIQDMFRIQMALCRLK